jgi:hypothetical protein
MIGGGRRRRRLERRKDSTSFFVKKEAKKLFDSGWYEFQRRAPIVKSFLLLFYKKEVLASLIHAL